MSVTDPQADWPPLDGRDVSRIKTEVRLAQLALIGLLTEERETGGTHQSVIQALDTAENALAEAQDGLGLALQRLLDHHGDGDAD